MKTVKIYDFITKQTTEIPKSELAPGMILATVDGVGQVWVSQAQVKPAPIRHPELPEEFLKIADTVYDGFAVTDGKRSGNLTNMTRQKWLDGFRRDEHPERELELWVYIWNFFKFARRHHSVGKSLEWQHDLYRLAVAIYTNGADAVLETFNPEVMTRLEVQALVEVHRTNAMKPEDL